MVTKAVVVPAIRSEVKFLGLNAERIFFTN
jgi:hypothetical protein